MTETEVCPHGIRSPHECRLGCQDVANPRGCICAYAHKSNPECPAETCIDYRSATEQRTSNPATADELRALATKAITDLWVLVGGQQTEIERLTRERDEYRDGYRRLSEIIENRRSDETAAAPKRAYYETHDPPHCPTCGCGAVETKPDGRVREIFERHSRVNNLLYGPGAVRNGARVVLGPMDSDAAHYDRGTLLSLLTPEQRGDRKSEKADGGQ